jgi:ATP-dependent Lon protease
MTGEVTLRGKALQIGGLKSKTIAAHRAGIKTVLLPTDNAKDIPELPDRIREDLDLVCVGHLEEVLAIALLESTEEPFGVGDEAIPAGESSVIPQVTNGSGSGEPPMAASEN